MAFRHTGVIGSGRGTRPGKVEVFDGMYGITVGDHIGSAKVLLDGGIRNVQYRPKGYKDRKTMLKEAITIREMCHAAGAQMTVDDDIELAISSGARGIWLGQKDMPLAVAMRMYGKELSVMTVGISVTTREEAMRAMEGGADALGVGPINESGTKTDENAVGIGPLIQVVKAAREFEKAKGRRIKVVAIGGLGMEDIERIVAAGADCMASIGAIFSNADSESAVKRARALATRWDTVSAVRK